MQEQQANPEQQSPPTASPHPSKHDLLETALVEMIVVLRDAFLRSCNGRPPMSYWDQIQTRVRGAARTSATAAEWVTAAQRGLRLGAPSSSDCLAINRLVAICDEYGMDLEAMEFMDCAKYDVMILDILMPRMSGLELVKKIRGRGDSTPVVFLTSLDSVEDRVAGLDGGGDYYLVKPFVMEELTAVVRVLARKSTDSRSNELSVADLTLNMTSQQAVRAGQEISLTPKEYALLEYMMRNKGIVLSREMIEDNLWNFDYEGGTNVVDVYVSFLRKKIDTGFDKKLIHTVWGTGWVMKEEN